MDTTQQRSLPPVAALIGALLALEGIREVIQLLLGALGNRLYQSQGGMEAFLHQISQDSQWWLKLLLGLLYVAVGLGLLRGARWARLGAMAVLALSVAFRLVAFLWPYGLELSYKIQPLVWVLGEFPRFLMFFFSLLFSLATTLAMLFFLALPAVRDAWQDQRAASLGLLDRWGAGIERRLPAGLPLVASFIAIYLICMGLLTLYSNIISLPTFWDGPGIIPELTYYLFFTLSLLMALGFILAGVALLRRVPWARRATLVVLGFAVIQLLFFTTFGAISFFTDVQLGKGAALGALFPIVASTAVNFLSAVAKYFILAVSLMRALPGTGTEAEAVEAT